MATSTENVVQVLMPQMGVSVSEGTVTKWMKGVGDAIQADETLLEISTDKVDVEVPSPGTGIVEEILIPEGQTVAVGTLLARISRAGQAPETIDPPQRLPDPMPLPPVDLPDADAAPAVFTPEPPAAPTPRVVPESAPPVTPPAVEPEAAASRPTFISPVVARIAAEHGIDPSTVAGTGRDDRVTKQDMLAALEARSAAETPTPEVPSAVPTDTSAEAVTDDGGARVAPAASAGDAPSTPEARPREIAGAFDGDVADQPSEPSAEETLEPMSAMRRGIAEHMRRSLDTAAHVTSAIEIDMTRVATIRERLKPEFKASYGLSPTYLAFIARAAVDTIRDWPLVNAEIRDGEVAVKHFVNLGVAVSLEGGKGLIVPVIKHAEGLNLIGMVRGIADLAERARTRKLMPDDVQGGSFTITNPGGFGTFLGTPIINQPQTAILGTYAVVKRPWVVADADGNDAIAIRSMMNATLTYDHRLVDGAYGAQFLHDLRERLETWSVTDY